MSVSAILLGLLFICPVTPVPTIVKVQTLYFSIRPIISYEQSHYFLFQMNSSSDPWYTHFTKYKYKITFIDVTSNLWNYFKLTVIVRICHNGTLTLCALVLPGADTGIGRLTFFPFFAECKGLIIKLPSLSACCKSKVIKMSKF